MDSRAKQRLTGAVILVALFVLLVPELLTGPRNADAPGTAAEDGMRRYTIDLNAPNPSATPVDPQPAQPVALPQPASPHPEPKPRTTGRAPSPETAAEPAAAAPARARPPRLHLPLWLRRPLRKLRARHRYPRPRRVPKRRSRLRPLAQSLEASWFSWEVSANATMQIASSAI